MRLTIENNPSESRRHEMAQIVAAVYNEEVTIDEVISYFEEIIGERWFFYNDGTIVAVHERDDNGDIVEERLIIITD